MEDESRRLQFGVASRDRNVEGAIPILLAHPGMTEKEAKEHKISARTYYRAKKLMKEGNNDD